MKSKGKLLSFRRVATSAEELGDVALIAACAVGDSNALGALYDRHHKPVFSFVSRLSCGPASDVEDLVQCTFLEVWKSAARFHKRGSVRSWILGISANLSRHYVRSEVRRRGAMDGYSDRPTQLGASPDDQVERAEMVDQLAIALRALTHDQRVAFVLCDIEEMSGVEAASLLQIRKGTLWRRLHDARKNLRVALEGGAKR